MSDPLQALDEAENREMDRAAAASARAHSLEKFKQDVVVPLTESATTDEVSVDLNSSTRGKWIRVEAVGTHSKLYASLLEAREWSSSCLSQKSGCVMKLELKYSYE